MPKAGPRPQVMALREKFKFLKCSGGGCSYRCYVGLVAGWPIFSHVCVKAWGEGNLKENLELKKENVKKLNLGPIVII